MNGRGDDLLYKAGPTELEILSIGKIVDNRNGNIYLECGTNVGIVAIWGTKAKDKTNTTNIDKIRGKIPPFKIRCTPQDKKQPSYNKPGNYKNPDLRNPKYRNHVLWIHNDFKIDD